MASRDASGVASSICLAKQADLEAVAFSCTGRRLARAAYGLGLGFREKYLGFRVLGLGLKEAYKQSLHWGLTSAKNACVGPFGAF